MSRKAEVADAILAASSPAEIGKIIVGIFDSTISIIDQHIPSLTDEDMMAVEQVVSTYAYGDNADDGQLADMAIRTCHCGKKIDGFYEYHQHLKDVLSGA